MTNVVINKLVIIGVGLIGGSFALALRKAELAGHIIGVGRSRENMARALKRGLIDEIAGDLPSALKRADIVFLAVPVGQTGEIMAKISPYLEPDSIVTDAGSTKQDVIAAARSHLTGNLQNFVPGHPIAGAEQSGAGAARADLFRSKNVVLTPLEETSSNAVNRVKELWQACGACVSLMSAGQHDKILATVSHLPHLLAFTLMNHVYRAGHGPDGMPRPNDPLHFAGTGFRDFTRIAASSPEMWRDICLGNREALVDQIDAYQRELAALRETLARDDGDALEKAFANAREARQQWLKNTS
ncbi:prephenate dehydrogenase/arogenate dehydrogenase family protein [Nitrosospira sp. NRS527]|uniref:prephenate dehydrogenase n=1 Tax=Nitrosospira sp. NRS527 TaxID=155925 RepID=UPI001AFC155A|nr:prephenate dehydrogenase/arogenate dehydrogenase family protein [Nitrosospira sp. NRS527]BCT68750.1 Cyclohexadienyl dehydrogenase [Nitrosospira sp. NRS527]